MDVTDRAYLAGLFDGEGSIRITTSYIPRLKRQHVTMGVKIAMQSYSSLEVFAECVDVNITKHGQCYECSIWQRKASNFLKEVYPLLRCKKDRALFAIIAYELMYGKRGKGANKLTEREKELRTILASIMKVLNKQESMFFYGKVGEFEGLLSPLVERLNDMTTSIQAEKGKALQYLEELQTARSEKAIEVSKALKGLSFLEGVTTTMVSPNNNPSQERPHLYH